MHNIIKFYRWVIQLSTGAFKGAIDSRTPESWITFGAIILDVIRLSNILILRCLTPISFLNNNSRGQAILSIRNISSSALTALLISKGLYKQFELEWPLEFPAVPSVFFWGDALSFIFKRAFIRNEFAWDAKCLDLSVFTLKKKMQLISLICWVIMKLSVVPSGRGPNTFLMLCLKKFQHIWKYNIIEIQYGSSDSNVSYISATSINQSSCREKFDADLDTR